MKRVNGLFEQIIAWDNLLVAVHRASTGKRHRAETQAFCQSLSQNLLRIREQLANDAFSFGRFHQFVIHDPKKRLITAPCFEERVVHHAIINVCEPSFERFLVSDTFACRKGRGRLAALKRCQYFSKRHTHYLKLDVRKYFDSVDQPTLLNFLERRFKDARLLRLFESIISCYEVDVGHGLPIGSLTSQHFANFYLGWFDRFVKEVLRVRGFVRYMDDCLLWGESRAEMRDKFTSAQQFLDSDLGLRVKSPVIENVKRGIEFLGCRVLPSHTLLNRRSRCRFRHKLVGLTEQFEQGKLTELEFQQRSLAMVAFTKAGGIRSWKYRSYALQLMSASD